MIPDWNMAGVIPPIRPGKSGHDQDRSPYQVSLSSLIDRFSPKSAERWKILEGFLLYRMDLHELGINNGIQWLDGSFMQDVEGQKECAPKDIDVVTYFSLPNGETQESLLQKNSAIFHHDSVKEKYKVDAYIFAFLGQMLSRHHVRNISYWYSMWSHCRDTFLWKGFLQISIDPIETQRALELLHSCAQEGVLYE